MSDENIERYDSDNLPESETDWERVRSLSDEDIERAIAADPDAAPILNDKFWKQAELVMPGEAEKIPISIRLDEEIVDFFKDKGPGYQTRINAVLRAYVRSQKRDAA